MDAASIYAIRFLEAIAGINVKLTEFARILRSEPQVSRIQHNFECHKYQSGAMLEGFVDAELHSRKAITWWLDVKWSVDQWVITARILLNHEQGQDVIKEFPDRITDEFNTSLEYLTQAADELLIVNLDLSVYGSP